jgi:hypothetical protein
MAIRSWTICLPVWVRVPAIIALVLVGVLVGTILLDAAGVGDGGRSGGGHGAGDETQMTEHTGGGDHGRGDGDHGADHGTR